MDFENMHFGKYDGLIRKILEKIIEYKYIAIPAILIIPTVLFLNYAGITHFNYDWNGIVIGQRELYASKGDIFYVDYETNIQKGCLNINIRKGNKRRTRPSMIVSAIDKKIGHNRHYDEQVCHSTKGRVEYTARIAGSHTVWFVKAGESGTFVDSDVSYKAHWGVLKK